MLESTFCHLPGVGEKTEDRIWRTGCTSWREFIDRPPRLPAATRRRLKAGIMESISRLNQLDHEYFNNRLPPNITWRAYRSFRDHTAYLDIETTGLSPTQNMVTTVCLHSGRETQNYVAGKNLNQLAKDLQDYKYLVTFNGACFDLPFLTQRLKIRFNQIHLDLMYPLAKLGYRGGLKKIEENLGINRDTDGVTGLDAVRLWKTHKTGQPTKINKQKITQKQALPLLIKYNQDDTVNLEKLADLTIKKLLEKHHPKR